MSCMQQVMDDPCVEELTVSYGRGTVQCPIVGTPKASGSSGLDEIVVCLLTSRYLPWQANHRFEDGLDPELAWF